jgi:N-formylglutamate deformylase
MLLRMSDNSGIHIHRPIGAAGAAVFSSPHSGRVYPRQMLARARIDAQTLRRSEDAFVDELFAAAPGFGAPLLRTDAPRAWVDLNRGLDELDPALIDGVRAAGLNPRLAAGLGVIPRVVAEGVAIYAGKITLAEANARLDRHWRPYHDALEGLLHDARARLGVAVLIDCHSMPSDALRNAPHVRGRRPEIVLGDRFGVSCAPWLMRLAEQRFDDAGFRVIRNTPFAGGYITQRYGRPSQGIHALQIEIDRALYLDEQRLEKSGNFDLVQAALRPVIAALAGAAQSADALAAE